MAINRCTTSCPYISAAVSKLGPKARVCSSMTGVNPITLLDPVPFLRFGRRSSMGPSPAVNAASPPNALMHWY